MTTARDRALAHWRWASVSPDDLEARATAHQFMAAWCDDFQRAMTWLCAPEEAVTVSVPKKKFAEMASAYFTLCGLGYVYHEGYGWRTEPRPEFNEHWRRP